MKVLAISGSPRKNGNTALLLSKALEGAQEAGAETELFSVAGKDLRGCDGCWACVKTGKCHLKDDLEPLYGLMQEADGIIFGTPIYFWGMTAQMKAIIDRSIALNHAERTLASKVAGVVAVAGSLGLVDALKDFSFYIIQRKMLPAHQVAAYVRDPKELADMEHCMKASYEMGRQIVALIKMGFRYPPEFTRGPGAFGTWIK